MTQTDEQSINATPFEWRDPSTIPPRTAEERAKYEHAEACDQELDADAILAGHEMARLQKIAEEIGGEVRDHRLFAPHPDEDEHGRRYEVWFDATAPYGHGIRVRDREDSSARAWAHGYRHVLGRLGLPLAANDNEPGAKAQRPRFQLTWFRDIAESEPKEHVIKGVFAVGEFSTIVGKPETGKSVITTDMACHIAAGLEWHGRAVQQGLVVYVAAERKKLTERRMNAFRKRHGVDDIPLVVVGGALDMTGGLADARALVEAIRGAEQASGFPCVLVIIDTLTRTFGAGDQHASKDMGKYVQAVDEIMRSLPEAHVSVIHHSPWNEDRGKGAIDLKGATDASFATSKGASLFHFKCTGANDAEEGPITSFRLESVEVGIGEDGEPTMAPVVVQADEEVGDKLIASVRGHNAKALEVLRATVADEGIPPDGPGFPDGILVVTEETWRKRFYEAAPEDTAPATLRKRFQRAKATLEANGSIMQTGQWLWPVTSGT